MDKERDQLWTYGDLAEFLQLAEVTVRKKVKRGELPRPVPGLGRAVRFDPSTVRQWLDKQRRKADAA